MNKINKKYRSSLDLLSIDDILLKKVKVKEINKPEWSHSNIIKEWGVSGYDSKMYIMPGWVDCEESEFLELHSNHTKKIDRKYFIYKNQKLCLYESFSDIKKTKPLEKLIYIYRTDDEMDRDSYAIDGRNNAQLNGEQIFYYPSGEIKGISYYYFDSKIGVNEDFYKNGHLRNWEYYKIKQKNFFKNTPENRFTINPYGEFCFWENGNIRFIAKFDKENSLKYDFVTFNINEEEEFAGFRNYLYQPMGSKTRQIIEVYRMNGKKLASPKRTRDVGYSGTSPLYDLKEFFDTMI